MCIWIMQMSVYSREILFLGTKVLLKYFSLETVDWVMVLLSKLYYGDLSKYGIARTKEGPFATKINHGKYPVLDLGTCKKIKSGEIQVIGEL